MVATTSMDLCDLHYWTEMGAQLAREATRSEAINISASPALEVRRLLTEARIAHRQGDLSTSRRKLETVLERAPHVTDGHPIRVEAHLALALVCADTGNVTEGENHIEAARQPRTVRRDVLHELAIYLHTAALLERSAPVGAALAAWDEAAERASRESVLFIELAAVSRGANLALVAYELDDACARIERMEALERADNRSALAPRTKTAWLRHYVWAGELRAATRMRATIEEVAADVDLTGEGPYAALPPDDATLLRALRLYLTGAPSEHAWQEVGDAALALGASAATRCELVELRALLQLRNGATEFARADFTRAWAIAKAASLPNRARIAHFLKQLP
jgi:hypothetical protein